jgi:cytochrome b561
MKASYRGAEKVIHGGLALFGIAAYLTADAAEGESASFGYLMHAYLGFTVAAFVIARLLSGAFGRREMRFASWWPFTTAALRLAVQDLGAMARLRLPDRNMHEGIAGLVQLFGLVLFAWMAGTGVALYFVSNDAIEGAHEVGEALIPAFLIAHVGAVIAHSVLGSPVWRRMLARHD